MHRARIDVFERPIVNGTWLVTATKAAVPCSLQKSLTKSPSELASRGYTHKPADAKQTRFDWQAQKRWLSDKRRVAPSSRIKHLQCRVDKKVGHCQVAFVMKTTMPTRPPLHPKVLDVLSSLEHCGCVVGQKDRRFEEFGPTNDVLPRVYQHKLPRLLQPTVFPG